MMIVFYVMMIVHCDIMIPYNVMMALHTVMVLYVVMMIFCHHAVIFNYQAQTRRNVLKCIQTQLYQRLNFFSPFFCSFFLFFYWFFFIFLKIKRGWGCNYAPPPLDVPMLWKIFIGSLGHGSDKVCIDDRERVYQYCKFHDQRGLGFHARAWPYKSL